MALLLFMLQKNGWSGTRFAKLLLEHGAHPDIMNKSGRTPLMFAVTASSSEKTCRLLLRYGASLVRKNRNGHTALMFLAADIEFRREKLCPILIEHQTEQERRAITLVLCLKHHETWSGRMLYSLSKHLLRPHLEQYTLKGLLNAQDNEGETAYDYWPIRLLKPIGIASQSPEDSESDSSESDWAESGQ